MSQSLCPFFISIFAVGCLPDMADDKAVAAQLAQSAAGDSAGELTDSSGANDTGSADADDITGATKEDAADAGPGDAGLSDTGLGDTGLGDTGLSDTGAADAASNDATASDATGDGLDEEGSKFCGDKSACDDGNSCTVDSCAPLDGACTHKPHTGPCSDGVACTLGDKCDDKANCKAGQKVLFDRILPETTTAKPYYALTHTSGDAIVVGQRNGQPWVARVTPLGAIAWQVKDGSTTGAWLGAAMGKNGNIVVGGYGGLKSLPFPRMGHVSPAGKILYAKKVSTYVNGNIRTVTALNPDLMAITLDREVTGALPVDLYTRTTGLRWVPSQNKIQAAIFGHGSPNKSAEIYNGVAEPMASRITYVGTREVSKAKTYDGWLLRMNTKTNTVTGNVTLGKSGIDSFYSVAARKNGGYFAAGGSDDQVSSHSEAWLVAFDPKLNVIFESHYGSKWSTWASRVVGRANGGAMLLGDVGVGANTALIKYTDGFVWRVNPFGATTRINHYGGDKEQGFTGWVPRGEGMQLFARHGPAITSTLRSIRVDAWGYASCAGSGPCIAKPLSYCAAAAAPCAVRYCIPTGACKTSALGKNEACGNGKICTSAASTAKCTPK
ncbi:MAG: hypothetical protein KC502_10070 [Myxococcales bacterium]|nr:hypothetical protein [Myxococcales bacterium]